MNIQLLAGADRSIGIGNPSLAVGLNDIAFYSTEIPFLNVLKQAGDRGMNDGAWVISIDDGNGNITRLDYSEAWHAGYLDADGNIATLPPGGEASVFLFNSIPAEAQTGGRYVFLYEGQATFEFPGATVVSSEPGRIVLDVLNGSSVGVEIVDLVQGNHPRNLALVREEHEELHEAGAIFNPDFISLFEDHRAIRFMDWMGNEQLPSPGVFRYRID